MAGLGEMLAGLFGGGGGAAQSNGQPVMGANGQPNWGNADNSADFFRADRAQMAQKAGQQPGQAPGQRGAPLMPPTRPPGLGGSQNPGYEGPGGRQMASAMAGLQPEPGYEGPGGNQLVSAMVQSQMQPPAMPGPVNMPIDPSMTVQGQMPPPAMPEPVRMPSVPSLAGAPGMMRMPQQGMAPRGLSPEVLGMLAQAFGAPQGVSPMLKSPMDQMLPNRGADAQVAQTRAAR